MPLACAKPSSPFLLYAGAPELGNDTTMGSVFLQLIIKITLQGMPTIQPDLDNALCKRSAWLSLGGVQLAVKINRHSKGTTNCPPANKQSKKLQRIHTTKY